jgi:hypothetical protein
MAAQTPGMPEREAVWCACWNALMPEPLGSSARQFYRLASSRGWPAHEYTCHNGITAADLEASFGFSRTWRSPEVAGNN